MVSALDSGLGSPGFSPGQALRCILGQDTSALPVADTYFKTFEIPELAMLTESSPFITLSSQVSNVD